MGRSASARRTAVLWLLAGVLPREGLFPPWEMNDYCLFASYRFDNALLQCLKMLACDGLELGAMGAMCRAKQKTGAPH
jgi:hypothetical protein